MALYSGIQRCGERRGLTWTSVMTLLFPRPLQRAKAHPIAISILLIITRAICMRVGVRRRRSSSSVYNYSENDDVIGRPSRLIIA